MLDSLREIGRTAYDDRQVASSLVYLAVPDGGWSRRRKTHAGSGHSGDDDALLDPAREPARIVTSS